MSYQTKETLCMIASLTCALLIGALIGAGL